MLCYPGQNLGYGEPVIDGGQSGVSVDRDIEHDVAKYNNFYTMETFHELLF